jgi:hypothetical protein
LTWIEVVVLLLLKMMRIMKLMVEQRLVRIWMPLNVVFELILN